MTKDKVLSYLGLATKAGKVQSGEFSTEKSVKTGKAALVIVASDASDNTKKKFKNMCTFYEVPFYIYGTKDALGKCIGKEFRASLALEDTGFCNAIKKQIDSERI
ncbi:MAG: ribosomal L7Ae/L30e/S12e/Gadd45 family protein [Frisingicoccus sp.]|nr:ribosomal L7Ae/L30e/S12e/Gadd45 family protein [Frisingicoccus sp.]